MGWPPSTGAGPCQVTKQADVPARMRDGVVLKADVYRPAVHEAVPVILMRTQYGKAGADIQPSRLQTPFWFASHCYLVVVQDIRGLGASGGTFYEYANDADDGYDTVEWAAALPGSNGKVGMYGTSYVGATQWPVAIRTPPHLVTIVPTNTSSDYYQNWTYEDGAFRLAFIEPWMMGSIARSAARQRGDLTTVAELTEAGHNAASWEHYRPYASFPPLHPGDPAVAPYFFDAIRHPTYDEYWTRWSIRGHYDQVTVPVLHFEGWYDAFLADGVENFTGMVAHGGTAAARAGQRIVIGPWDHLGWGRPGSITAPMLKDIGPVANSPINELMLAWFDHYLKGQSSTVAGSGPTVDYFEMGANRWRSSTAWPVPGTRFTRYYLGSGGHANTSIGDGTLSAQAPGAGGPTDTYRYDPSDPVPSVGGHSCCAAISGPQGPYDQGPVEQRPDVLVYTTAPLTEGTEVTGPTHGHPVCGDLRTGHRLHRQAGRPARGRDRAEPEQWHPECPAAYFTGARRTGHSRPGQRVHHPCVADQLPVSGWEPDPAGDLQQRVPAVRAEPEHRSALRHRHHLAGSRPDDLPRSRPPVLGVAADRAVRRPSRAHLNHLPDGRVERR